MLPVDARVTAVIASATPSSTEASPREATISGQKMSAIPTTPTTPESQKRRVMCWPKNNDPPIALVKIMSEKRTATRPDARCFSDS